MERNAKAQNLTTKNHVHIAKHVSPAPTTNQYFKQSELTVQMQNLKLNRSDQRVPVDQKSNDESQRYEENDEAFIEFSTMDDPVNFNKSYSNANILQGLEDDRYSKRTKTESDNDILGQLDYLMESNMQSQNDIDIRGLESMVAIDKNSEIDKFTEELMMDSIERSYMFEPMVDIKKMTENYIKKRKDQMNNVNMKTLTLIEKVIDLLKRNECRTKAEKKKILELFNDIQNNGGLPKVVERDASNRYPDMAMFIVPKSDKEYVIF